MVLLCACLSSCYDSTWGETKRGQARNAKAATPAQLETSETDPHRLPKATHTYRIRIFASPNYVTQTIDWQKQVRTLVDDGNDVLGPDLDAHLEIESMSSWSDLASEDSADGVLAALHAKDSGDGVDWVAGFIGGISKVDPSFHELGYGDVPGKYVVLRAVSVMGERDSIDRAFNELSQDERARISRERKQHRATSVYLHEIGHTLAALHEHDRQSLMNPNYDPRMSRFSDAAISLMRVSLAHRDHLTTRDDMSSYAHDLLAVLQGPASGTWIASERSDLIQRLEKVSAPQDPSPPIAPQASAAATAAAPPPTIVDDPALNPGDQAIYHQAMDRLRAGDATAAGEIAKPLFPLYPKLYSVQDLRCQIAMKRDGWPAAEPECKTLMKLSR
jgi:hypothetical protein